MGPNAASSTALVQWAQSAGKQSPSELAQLVCNTTQLVHGVDKPPVMLDPQLYQSLVFSGHMGKNKAEDGVPLQPILRQT